LHYYILDSVSISLTKPTNKNIGRDIPMEIGLIIITLFFTSFASATACAIIGYNRGVSPVLWFVLGLLLNLPALFFVSIALPNHAKIDEKGLMSRTHKRCGYCDEVVRRKAVKCRYCHSTLEVEEPQQK
jgi:hypothetical protein